MLDIRVVVNYFGHPPQAFQLWLDSCGANGSINWMFFTDTDMSKYHVPDNVKIIFCDFDWMRQRICKSFAYPVKYSRPYDFCGFKPLIGTIFKNELEGADFWGWSDVDMLYGDLSPVVEMAKDGYDKVMPGGHFSIIRNSPELNRFILGHQCTKQALALEIEERDRLPCYDEVDFPLKVMNDYGARQESDIIPFVHLNPRCGHFKLDGCMSTRRLLDLNDGETCPLVLTWCNGSLKGYFALSNKTVRVLDLAYVHFFKRDIKDKIGRLENDGTEYLILPGGIDKVGNGNAFNMREYWNIRMLDFPRIHWQYFIKRLNWSTFKRKIGNISMK